MQTTRLAVTLLFALAANSAAQSTPDLTGLWGATLRFGPDTRGPLIIYRTRDGWRADIAGFTVAGDIGTPSVPCAIDNERAAGVGAEAQGGAPQSREIRCRLSGRVRGEREQQGDGQAGRLHSGRMLDTVRG